ncbi:hypothetical protein D3C72_1801510 [compost metagenome]
MGEFDHVAHAVDLDHRQLAFRRLGLLAVFRFLVVAVRCQHTQVGMVAGGKPVAGLALAAGVVIGLRRLAQQRTRHFLREFALADAGRAAEQPGIGQTLEVGGQPLPVAGLPRVTHQACAFSMARRPASCCWMSAMSPVASTTKKRCG